MASRKKSSEIAISKDGWAEIDSILEDIKRGLIIEAAHLAHKEGHEIVDRMYIKKVSQHLSLPKASTTTWFLRIILTLSISLVILQIGSLASLSLLYQPLLWILPIFVIFFVIVMTFIFKDYL